MTASGRRRGAAVKRILDCRRDDFAAMSRPDLLDAIRRAEGRTILCEVLWPAPPLAGDVPNADLAVAFGADLVLLNMFDEGDLVALKERLGRPVGVNVEPSGDVPEHRRASAGNVRRLASADFLVVTANPDATAGLDAIVEGVETVRRHAPGAAVMAGTMHGSGGRALVDPADLAAMAEVADAVLVPAPGTLPGSVESRIAEGVDAVHRAGRLAVATIGTSQEGADADTVRLLALAAKRCGADVLHLGDAGACGIADPMNVLQASLAVRGRRHTYRRMAAR